MLRRAVVAVCFLASRAAEAELQAFWENADPTFSHITYDRWLQSEKKLVSEWRNRWLDATRKLVKLEGLRVAEYGIGGGLLGHTLLSKYRIGHYKAFDIAQRQIEAAKTRLEQHSTEKWALERVDELPNMAGTADIFVSQAVMQHFPSQEYTELAAQFNGPHTSGMRHVFEIYALLPD